MLERFIVSSIPSVTNKGDEDAQLLEAGIELNRQAVAIRNVNDREHSRGRDRRPGVQAIWEDGSAGCAERCHNPAPSSSLK